MPPFVGTFQLETSTGCTFTSSLLGRLFSNFQKAGSSNGPSKELTKLLGLRRDFDRVVAGRYEELLHIGSGPSYKGLFNLGLLHECAKPGVEYHFRPLGILSSSFFLDHRLMETIDTIYYGSFIEEDSEGLVDEAGRDLARASRPADMPKVLGKGLNRTLACFDEDGSDGNGNGESLEDKDRKGRRA